MIKFGLQGYYCYFSAYTTTRLLTSPLTQLTHNTLLTKGNSTALIKTSTLRINTQYVELSGLACKKSRLIRRTNKINNENRRFKRQLSHMILLLRLFDVPYTCKAVAIDTSNVVNISETMMKWQHCYSISLHD